jgi:hypothetical protein
MDNFIRFVTYLLVGAVLLYCGFLYVRALSASWKADDYVILPVKVIGREDKDGSLGIGLAQMLQARLKSIERELADAQEDLTAAPKPVTLSSPGATVIRFLPLFNEQAVRLPTSLLQPASINLAVGGIQVGGVIPWIQNLMVQRRTLSFTFDLTDSTKTTVAGDAAPLSGSQNGAIWLESQGSLQTVISDLSYELLRRRLMNDGGKQIDRLSPSDFQTFATTLVRVAELDRDGAGAALPPQGKEFYDVFQKIWPVASRHASDWPEFGYFAAGVAEKAGDSAKAIQLYTQFKVSAQSPSVSARVRQLADDGTVDSRIAALSAFVAKPRDGRGAPREARLKFDVPVTMEGSTKNAVVYYATALGSTGSRVAQAVMNKLESDLARLTQFFGGTTLPKPLNVIIGEFYGGAYHLGCSNETVYVSVKTEPKLDPDFSNFLVVTQAADVFGAVQGKGWDCGVSQGAGLKRAIAAELYPGQLGGFATAAVWLDSQDRPDWVNKNKPTDTDPAANGCAVLFVNYLHSQLKIPWEEITQAGGRNLGETYAHLGLGNDGFAKFRQLIDAKFPIGQPSRVTTDNPFPL